MELTRKEANARYGSRRYSIARCAKCHVLYLATLPGPSPIGEHCLCGGLLWRTTWGKSPAMVLR